MTCPCLLYTSDAAELETDPKLVYLSTVGVKFTAEAGDPKGTWTVAITVRDTLRNVAIPLQSSFEMR